MYYRKYTPILIILVLATLLDVPKPVEAGIGNYLPSLNTFNPFYWLGMTGRNATSPMRRSDTGYKLNYNGSTTASSTTSGFKLSTTQAFVTTVPPTTVRPTTILPRQDLTPNTNSSTRMTTQTIMRTLETTAMPPNASTSVSASLGVTTTIASTTQAPSSIKTTKVATIGTTSTKPATTFSPGSIISMFPTPKPKIQFDKPANINNVKKIKITRDKKIYEVSVTTPQNVSSPSVAFDSTDTNRIQLSTSKKLEKDLSTQQDTLNSLNDTLRIDKASSHKPSGSIWEW